MYILKVSVSIQKDLIIDILRQLSFKTSWEFSGGPVVRTRASIAMGPVQSPVKEVISCKPGGMTKNEKISSTYFMVYLNITHTHTYTHSSH